MPDIADVRELARRNFEDSALNLDADLAETRTPQDAWSVRNNHERALSCYLTAIRTALQCSGEIWIALLSQARDAEAELVRAREKAQSTIERIKAAGKLTDAVSKLVVAAK